MISIHALREEGDGDPAEFKEWTRLFLSTPSARRATSSLLKIKSPDSISIHALREEGDGIILAGYSKWLISIHALREEGDLKV